jgi:CheY-like chemotaxis protein
MEPQTYSVPGPESVGIRRPAAVLVVDDDEDIREMIRGVLEQEGYLAILASDGEEALSFLRQRSIRFGLVVVDLLMPKMDGWEFQWQRLREPEIRAIPMVVMTAHSGTLVDSMIEHTTIPVIAKPIDFDRLLRVVARYCS